MEVDVANSCAHCGREIHIHFDSELNFDVREAEARPLVFEPHVDWATYDRPTIIDGYWKNSVFFWSEEHARAHRAAGNTVDGLYLTLEQAAMSTPISQGTLFAFGT